MPIDITDLNKNSYKPLISVIIATYNRADLIYQAIQSVLNQTFQDFEIIIVDDGSTDNTEEIIRSIDDVRINYLYTANWGGPARPRNIGIKLAKGDYIAFCDADDYWVADKLKKQLIHFENPEFIGIGSTYLKTGDLSLHKQIKPFARDIVVDFEKLLLYQTAALSSLIVRNRGFLFDEDENFKFVEDFDFQLHIVSETNMKIKILSEPLVYYRIHTQNATRDVTIKENVFFVLQKYKDITRKKILHTAYYLNFFNLGINALRINSKSARQYFMSALEYSKGFGKLLPILMIIISNLPGHIPYRMLRLYYSLSK